MTDKEAMKLALDALETEVSIDWTNNDEFNASAEKMHEAITALKEALAQPEQEPVATLWQHGETGRTRVTMPGDITDCDARWFKAADLYTTPPQRTEQNFCPRCGKRTNDIHTCTPPQENT